ERLARRHDPQLLPIRIDDPHLACANPLIDTDELLNKSDLLLAYRRRFIGGLRSRPVPLSLFRQQCNNLFSSLADRRSVPSTKRTPLRPPTAHPAPLRSAPPARYRRTPRGHRSNFPAQ